MAYCWDTSSKRSKKEENMTEMKSARDIANEAIAKSARLKGMNIVDYFSVSNVMVAAIEADRAQHAAQAQKAEAAKFDLERVEKLLDKMAGADEFIIEVKLGSEGSVTECEEFDVSMNEMRSVLIYLESAVKA